MSFKQSFHRLWSGLTILGPRLVFEAFIQPWRRTYFLARLQKPGRRPLAWWRAWRQARPAHPPDWDHLSWTFVDDLVSYTTEGREVTLACGNAAIRLTILSPDLVQVRLSRDGEFPAPLSYAIATLDEHWPIAFYEVVDGDEALFVRTDRLLIRASKHPCRLAFLDPSGKEIHADLEGMGWSGEAVIASQVLPAEEHVYGLGEKAFGLDRRGRTYEMWNNDPQGYGPGEDPIYLNIPFYVGLRGTHGYGLFFDNSYRAHFDVGASEARRLSFAAAGGEMCYYFLQGPSLRTVLERYTELTGRMPMPPMWFLGFQQSRWSYYPEARVREIAKQLRTRNIPCDAIHLDIHYMDGYRCFSWDAKRFSDPRGLINDLRSEGFQTVVILDPALKADPDYAAYGRGLQEGAFVKYPDGTPFRAPVWPGSAGFPDFTSGRVRTWWAEQCREFWSSTGVAGFWTDMNEPTLFSRTAGETIPDPVVHDMDGRGGTHAEAHNVYGMLMARSTREGWQAWKGADRPVIITRSGYAGVQRYASHWTGDNESTWEHLALTIPMVLGLGMSGLAFTGSDTGGFSGPANGELLTRWTQLSAFTPYFRNHSAGPPNREPWAFGEPFESATRSAVELRYRLLPYIYTAAWQCAETGLPISRPLCLDFQADPEAHILDDEFMLGDALLVAPILRPGATTRHVYLPSGTWYHFATGRCYEGPATIVVEAPLAEVPILVRAGSVVPMWPVMQYVGQRPVATLGLHIFPGRGTSWLYEDDGRSLEYQRGAFRVTRFELTAGPGSVEIERTSEGSYQSPYSRYQVAIHGLEAWPGEMYAGNQLLTGWSHDPATRTLEVEIGELQRLSLKWA